MKQVFAKSAGVAALTIAASLYSSGQVRAADLPPVANCDAIQNMAERFRCFRNPRAYRGPQEYVRAGGGISGGLVRVCDAFLAGFFYIPGTETCLRVGGGIGIAGRTVPRTQAGTQFSAALGREVGITATQRSMRGAALVFSLYVPLFVIMSSIQPRGRPADRPASSSPYGALQPAAYFEASVAALGDANKNAIVPNGTNNVAFTFAQPNILTGTTGVLFGASGQAVNIASRGMAFSLEAGVDIPVAQFNTGHDAMPVGIGAFARIGGLFDVFNVHHRIDQASIAFANHHMATNLRTRQYLLAPVFGLGLVMQMRTISFYALASIAPGILFANGSFDQSVQCPFCPLAGDQAFAHARSQSRSWFSMRSSVEAGAQMRFPDAVVVRGRVRLDHYSRSAYMHNPITPSEQPARLRMGSSKGITASVEVLKAF